MLHDVRVRVDAQRNRDRILEAARALVAETGVDATMEDIGGFGPQSGRNYSSYDIVRSRTCGSGVVITVDFQKGPEENLWVQKSDRTIVGATLLPRPPHPVAAR